MAPLFLVMSALAAGPAEPPPAPETTEVRRYIQAAAVLYASLDNKGALAQLARAKAMPHAVEDDVLISLYEGLIQSDNGRAAESEAAFRAAFALDPNAALPIPVSPKLEAWVERIRAEVKKTLARSQLAPAPVLKPRVEEPAPVVVEPAPPPAPRRAWIPAAAIGGALLVATIICAVLEQGVEGRLRAGDPTITTAAQLDSVYGEGRSLFIGSVALGASSGLALALAAILFAWQ